MLEVTYLAHQIIKETLVTTGARIDLGGKEQPEGRALYGAERSQRSHYLKKLKPIEEKALEESREILDKYKKLYNEKRDALPKEEKNRDQIVQKMFEEDEKLQEAVKERKDGIEAIQQKKHQLKLTPKTMKVLRKYFIQYAVDAGFTSDLDDVVDEIEAALKIKPVDYKVEKM